jgi:LacI family transcriptional regulator
VSLKVLAEHLSLSPATISLVLNDAPAGKSIPQVTRDRVQQAAKALGYRPSFLGRSLRKNRSYTIGALVPEISDPYSTLVLSGVDDLLQEEGYLNFTVAHRRKRDLIEEYPQILLQRSVEGIIAVDTSLEKPISVPVVKVGGDQAMEGVTNISLDHRRAAELVLRHLYKLGHRNVAFMRGADHSSDAKARWESLMHVAQELGLKYSPELTVKLELDLPTPELGYPVVGQLLATKRPFTALVCFNDIAAIGAIRGLVDAGLRVPEDVSIVGFDDIHNAAYNNPSLTTIRQPFREMGRMAARILLKRIRSAEEVPSKVLILPELIIRESTLPPNPRRTRPVH